MGQELRCTARLGDTLSEGRVLLEADELLFRGDFRLHIPFADVRSAEARDGNLTLVFSEGWVVFELGDKAEVWAQRIRNPRTLADRLGIQPGAHVAVLGCGQDILELVRSRTVLVSTTTPRDGSDLIFLGGDAIGDLDAVGKLAGYLAPRGALWVLRARGRAGPTQAEVLEAGRRSGLVDTKIVRVSDTHTAHRFVTPRGRA